MNFITPKVEIITPQGYDLVSLKKHMEICARNCYKSEDKITDTSYERMYNMMINSKHYAMLEHIPIYLDCVKGIAEKYINNKYSKVVKYDTGETIKLSYIDYEPKIIKYCVTSNMRVIVENGWEDDLQYMCEPKEYHEKRITVRFTTDIGVTREANRHRVNSPAEESTRYCNYTKEKFGNGLNIALNSDITSEDECKNTINAWGRSDINAFRNMCKSIYDYSGKGFGIIDTWLFVNFACQWGYERLINLGWKSQQARRILPLDTKSCLIHSAFESDWKHFINLRSNGTTGAPHPDMKLVADQLKKILNLTLD